MQLLIGVLLAALISYVAHLAGSLSRGGAVAAACVGTVVFGLGGWQWAVLLLVFFVSSSLLSQSLRGPRGGAAERFAKGSRRDAAQVLGNGAVAVIWVTSHVALPQSAWPWFGYAAALAAVTADTWSTEIGMVSRTAPRLITHPAQRVSRGTSGGVSFLGTLAAVAGSAIVAGAAGLLLPMPADAAVGIIVLGGLAGALFDSLLGATLQSVYRCPKDNVETEQHPLHRCGTPTIYVRGWSRLNNDWVNAACGAFGSLAACALALALGAR